MRARGSGTILNIVSIGEKQTFPQWGAYCAIDVLPVLKQRVALNIAMRDFLFLQ